jgi:predicted GIY-YIG superfamily endonuclease
LSAIPTDVRFKQLISRTEWRDLFYGRATLYLYSIKLKRSTLYIGFTSDLRKRVFEHESGIVEGFTKKYKCTKLVYYEAGNSFEGVLAR